MMLKVRLPCWEEDSELMAWAKDKGLSGARGLFDYFETRAIAMATQLNRTAVLWQVIRKRSSTYEGFLIMIRILLKYMHSKRN